MALVQTTDLSTLRDTLNSALNGTGVGGGYNQSHTVASNPAVGDDIDDSFMDSIFSASEKLANYYNITNPFTAVNAGDTIAESQYKTHASSFNSSVAARIADPWDYSSGWDMSTATETTENVTDWNGSREQIVQVSFADQNTMDAWFSAGGEIRVSASHNDTSNNQQGTSWEQLTAEMGIFRISLRPTDGSGVDDRSRVKYSDLTTSYVEYKKEYADDSDYSANYIAIEIQKSGTNINVKTILADAHVARTGSGSGYGGPWSFTGADQAVGTSTVNVSSLKLSNAASSVNITNPSFTVTDNL
jgi:hypothetical protein